MSDLGKLCHKYGGTALAYKRGGNALVFKTQTTTPGNCVIEVDWRPQTWICQTYNIEHQIVFTCTGAFTAGSGSVTRTAGTSSVTFTLSGISGTATFTITFSNNSGCSTTEDPGVKVNIIAAQSGATPRMLTNTHCPMANSGSKTVSVSFDSSGKLTGVQ